MDEDLGSSYITIEDEDGNEFELEQLATMEFNGNEYSAFLPADMAEDDPDYGLSLIHISSATSGAGRSPSSAPSRAGGRS